MHINFYFSPFEFTLKKIIIFNKKIYFIFTYLFKLPAY